MIHPDRIALQITCSGSLCRVELELASARVFRTVRESALIHMFVRGDAILERLILRGQRLVKEFDLHEKSTDKITRLILPYTLGRRVTDHLYPYQRSGVAWLLRRRRGLLADDMGLGKTYQAISAARRLFRFGFIKSGIVVAPRTLVSNWTEELEKWAPELSVASIHRFDDVEFRSWPKIISGHHLVVISYEVVRVAKDAIIECPPDLIIADEAHRLRKRESLTFQNFRQIPSKYFWALTGTPMERSTEDLNAIMSLVDPRRFSAVDVDLHRSSLQARARPYFLRRTKAEVLSQLPGVIERTEVLELSDPQRKAYDDTRRSGLIQNPLVCFTKLRELCDLHEASSSSSKIDRAVEIISDVISEAEKVVVFSYTLAPLILLHERLREASIDSELFVGQKNLVERNSIIEKFKANENSRVLLASTKIASEGLNLTEANHVVFLNKWWNPSSNAQARDRVVRIGQRRVVTVVSFVCKHTVEERLERILSDKSKTYDQVISALTKGDRVDIL